MFAVLVHDGESSCSFVGRSCFCDVDDSAIEVAAFACDAFEDVVGDDVGESPPIADLGAVSFIEEEFSGDDVPQAYGDIGISGALVVWWEYGDVSCDEDLRFYGLPPVEVGLYDDILSIFRECAFVVEYEDSRPCEVSSDESFNLDTHILILGVVWRVGKGEGDGNGSDLS